jgi:hypothetical protein
MERFYHAIGMPINIKELIGRDVTDAEIKEMTRKCSRDFTRTCGCLKVLKAEDMEAIYRMARNKPKSAIDQFGLKTKDKQVKTLSST